MITKYRNEEIDSDKVQEWIAIASEDGARIVTCLNTFRRDIYLLVYKDAHIKVGCSRRQLFGEVGHYSTVSKKTIHDFVNAAMVETVLRIVHGMMSVEALLALKNHANIEDWIDIFELASEKKEARRNINFVKRIAQRRRKCSRFTKIFPSKEMIIEEIKIYYSSKVGHEVDQPKKPDRKSVYADWDADLTQYQDVDRRYRILFGNPPKGWRL